MSGSKQRATLTRQTLSRLIAQHTHLSTHDVSRVLERLISLMSDALIKGERVEIENFLTLETVTVTRNAPYSDDKITYRVLRCVPGRALRRGINNTMDKGTDDVSDYRG
jgi:nucleoid DNA-binding protein